jgi:hypothetical protein
MWDRLQVFGIDTDGVAAEMVNGETSRDGANIEFIGPTMSVDHPLTIPGVPVAVRIDCGRPLPTPRFRVRFYLVLEAG